MIFPHVCPHPQKGRFSRVILRNPKDPKSRLMNQQALFSCLIFSYTKIEIVKTSIKRSLQSIFDRFYIDEINKCKIGDDLQNHNKLRLYATVKGCFKREPYIDLVQSRNQRAWLSRLRCYAHHLKIEQGRWKKIPVNERICKVCNTDEVGDEYHAVMKCKIFDIKRACYLSLN
jgi:hypothetical protein